MKKIILPLVAISFLIVSCGGPSEEKKDSSEEFSELATEEGFAEKHDEPKEMDFTPSGSMETMAVEGGDAANYYFLENTEETNKYLFVIHEWWGLNDHIKSEAERFFNELGNVHVMALDLYDGKVATNRDSAGKYMMSADADRINSILDAVISSLPENAEVGTIGWCFGGGWSLKTALAAGVNTKACVMYYGMPVEDIEQLKTLSSDVLFIFAEQDQWINKEVADKFKTNMKAAGKNLMVKSFDADHAFANPTQEHYLEAAAAEANALSLEFLQERL